MFLSCAFLTINIPKILVYYDDHVRLGEARYEVVHVYVGAIAWYTICVYLLLESQSLYVGRMSARWS